MDWLHRPEMVYAAQAVRNGGVVACPTEGVWGLSCDVRCEDAVRRILGLKGRPSHKGLILITDHVDRLTPYVGDLSAQQWALVRRKPNLRVTTWLVPLNNDTPSLITGEHSKLAVRVTAHPPATALCALVGAPLVSTSANTAGCPAAKTRAEVLAYFGDSLDYVAPGSVGGAGAPSEIRDILTSEVVRAQ